MLQNLKMLKNLFGDGKIIKKCSILYINQILILKLSNVGKHKSMNAFVKKSNLIYNLSKKFDFEKNIC